MHDIAMLEEYYRKCLNKLDSWAPEDFIEVDVRLLERLKILDEYNENPHDYTLTQEFHYTESEDKITLLNDQFIVWIVPENIDGSVVTFTMIAINHPERPHLELIYTSRGIYNTSNLVLRVLEKFLLEIQENEKILQNMGNAK
jgi:hypothetical protein